MLHSLKSLASHVRSPSPFEYDSFDDDQHLSNDQHQYLLPPVGMASGSSSALSSINNTPIPSRASSPRPQPIYPTSTSTSEDEPNSPLLTSSRHLRRRQRWWMKRRKRDATLRGWKRTLQKVVKHPLFPTQPLTILLSLLLITTIALLITLFLIYILNPDKYPLPWRQYCYETPQFPPPPNSNPHYNFTSLPPAGVYLGVFSMDAAVERRMLIRSTWASHQKSRGTDGSTDRTIVRFVLGRPRKEWERRIKLEMEAYNDIVILPIAENMNNGKSHAYYAWAHSNAFVPPLRSLPDTEVPPVEEVPSHTANPDFSTTSSASTSTSTATEAQSTTSIDPSASSSHTSPRAEAEDTAPAPLRLAPHDPTPPVSVRRRVFGRHHSQSLVPRFGHTSASGSTSQPWVRPDFVFKADDDSFIMLAELEGRLRVELAEAKVAARAEGRPDEEKNPKIFWGYLVKNRFMAGELYGLSRSLVEYVATTASLKGMTRGAEDKQTAKWIRLHPEAERIRWRSDHCWIYDHPRAGTVYSHGFLFPSEWQRVKQQVQRWIDGGSYSEVAYTSPQGGDSTSSSSSSSASTEDSTSPIDSTTVTTSESQSNQADSPATASPSASSPNKLHPWTSPIWHLGPPDPSIPPPPISPFLSHSTVSKFGTRYSSAVSSKFTNLTAPMEVEALVEASTMALLKKEDGEASGDSLKWDDVTSAWEARESWNTRYLVPEGESRDGALGGTVCVHFIKKNEWYMETALAFLGGASKGWAAADSDERKEGGQPPIPEISA